MLRMARNLGSLTLLFQKNLVDFSYIIKNEAFPLGSASKGFSFVMVVFDISKNSVRKDHKDCLADVQRTSLYSKKEVNL